MPTMKPDAVRELQRSFTERLAEQMRASREGRAGDIEAVLAEKRAYLQQRTAALMATEAARKAAITRFDADIEHRRQQIAQLEASLKEVERARKEAKGGGKGGALKSPVRKRAKPA